MKMMMRDSNHRHVQHRGKLIKDAGDTDTFATALRKSSNETINLSTLTQESLSTDGESMQIYASGTNSSLKSNILI